MFKDILRPALEILIIGLERLTNAEKPPVTKVVAGFSPHVGEPGDLFKQIKDGLIQGVHKDEVARIGRLAEEGTMHSAAGIIEDHLKVTFKDELVNLPIRASRFRKGVPHAE